MSNIDHRVGIAAGQDHVITAPPSASIGDESVALPPNQWMHHMPQSHIRPEPSLLPIERPRCPKCQAGRMMLGRIEPAPAGADLRTFECPKCEYVHKVLVDDPFQSAKTRWTNSDLNPPK